MSNTDNIRTGDNYNVSSQDLKKNFKYSDKDTYDIFQEIKNKKIHRFVYSILMLMFLVVTYVVILMKKPKNTTPIFLYVFMVFSQYSFILIISKYLF